MDIVGEIKACKTDEELKELADKIIKKNTESAMDINMNYGYIGQELDINPINYHITDSNFEPEYTFNTVPFWNGYIPLGTKIVYGGVYSEKYRTCSNRGSYYYLDDDNYIYEFFKYIKDKEVEDENDIVIYIATFLKNKFDRYYDAKDRDEMHKLIMMAEDLYFKPTKEHSIKDFYNNGSAMCSEYAVVAENIMSALGFKTLLLFDSNHSFNVFIYSSGEEIGLYVLDYSNTVDCYNIKLDLIGYIPFFGKIDCEDVNILRNVILNGERLEFDDYFMYKINGCLYKMILDQKRSYGTNYAEEKEKRLILKRENDAK